MYIRRREKKEREREREEERERKAGRCGVKEPVSAAKRHTPASPRDTGYLANQFAKLKYENQSEQSGAIPSFKYFIYVGT